MERLIKLTLALSLLFFSTVTAVSLEQLFEDFYPADYPDNKADLTLLVNAGGFKASFAVHREHRHIAKLLQNMNAEEKGKKCTLTLDEGEYSAFKKIIYFLYHFESSEEAYVKLYKIYNANDLTNLIRLTLRYRIQPLGVHLSKFFVQQIEQKLKMPQSEILLDHMDSLQFEFFYQNIFPQEKPAQDWFTSIANNLNFYIELMHELNDGRIKDLPHERNPLIRQAILKIRSDNRADIEERQEHSDAMEQAENIFKQFQQDINQKRQPTPVGERHRYRVHKRLAPLVLSELQKLLPAYSVYFEVTVEDWTVYSELGYRDHCTAGWCLAEGTAWTIYSLMWPLQVLSLNYCGCCGKNAGLYDAHINNDCCCSTQFAALMAISFYNAGSCNHRWIVIEQKARNKEGLRIFLPPPPAEHH